MYVYMYVYMYVHVCVHVCVFSIEIQTVRQIAK